MDAAGRSSLFLKRKLNHWHCFSPRSLHNSSTMAVPPTPALSSTLDLEAGQASEIGQQDPPSPNSTTEVDVVVHNPESPDSGGQDTVAVPRVNPLNNFDGNMVVAFCFASAVEIALQSLQPQIQIPLLVHLLSLALVFVFSSFFVANYFIPLDQFTRFSHALIHVGNLSVFVAFFLAITVPFSLSFKLISWSVFFLSLPSIAYAVAASRRLRRHRA